MTRGSVRYASEIVLRAERRLGEILAVTVRHTGGGPPRAVSHQIDTARLPSAVTRNQSSRAQKLAAIPGRVP